MAQSLNTNVQYQTKVVSYLGLGGKVGSLLLGDKALEFYNDKNVNDYIQIPWSAINHIGANVRGKKVSRHFEIFTDQGKFLFASKDTGTILKITRQHIGNDKVVKLPTLIQTIMAKLLRKKQKN
ncbi:DUF956 family protein [Streptococcus ictaluri]|uniref:PF06115 domain protein n=1 Tax=Streptococcus ictaluri 707-05 TaxID=764299 RepID=G5K045_9STRE|nr:DUF956 family protein [Streptococcus ictaluri]EHI71001.1 hypothetical protein STRIC_0910 [Streptococcus ictaluri 707-05]